MSTVSHISSGCSPPCRELHWEITSLDFATLELSMLSEMNYALLILNFGFLRVLMHMR